MMNFKTSLLIVLKKCKAIFESPKTSLKLFSVLLVISVFLLSSCEVYKTLYGGSPKETATAETGKVARVEGDNAKDPATMAKEVYAAASPTQHDPFKVSQNPLGPFDKGKPLGFTLGQWLSASGIGIYSVDGNTSDLELSFKNLVPNGVYSVLCSRITMPPEPSITDKPCGADDGSQNSFTSDEKGTGSISIKSAPLEQSTKETSSLIALAYHSDGKTYGASPGDYGLNSHVQLFFMLPQPAGNATKFEVPIKFQNHVDAGFPEQDVFVEVEEQKPNATINEVQENTSEQKAPETRETKAAEPVTGESTYGQVIPQQKNETYQEQPKEKPIVINVQETDMVNLVPKAYDPDKDKLAFTYTSPINDSGQWQTTYGDAGQYTITFTASDGQLTTSRDILLIVNKKEEAPTIDVSKPIESGLTMDEGQTMEFSIEASDLNKDPLAYNWKLDGVDVGNGKSYNYQTEFGSAGTHTVKFDVSDGTLSASKIWSVNVRHLNRPPVLESISNIQAKETDKIVITAFATDADNDPLNYTISDKRFTQDNNVFTWQTDYGNAGVYDVTVSVSDGQAVASRTFTLNVQKLDRPPVILDIVQSQ